MSRGPIQAQPRERLDDRSGHTLALWEKEDLSGTPAELPWRPVDSLAPTEWQRVLQGAHSVVMACTSRHPTWMEEAATWCSRTARLRTYLLGPESWVSSAPLQALVKAGASRLLTRLGPEPPADWIVADRQRGWLLLGAPGEGRRWVLPLTSTLARGLHEAFVHLFWHRARRESAPGARFRDCLPAPFPAPSEAVRALACGQLVERTEGGEPLLPDAELIVEPRGALGPGAPRLLLTPPRPEGFASLSERVGRGGEVAWFDAGLPRLALTRRRMVVELGEGPSRLQLEFEAEDAIQMKNALELRAAQGAWRFHPARALREVRGQVWVEGAAAQQPVHDELALSLGEVEAEDLLALDRVTPASWREPSALARCIRYQWRAVPPRPPTGTRPAKLLREWEAVDSHVDKRASDARAHLERMEREEETGGLLTRLSGLVSRWRDVSSRRKRLRLALAEILEQPLSRRPAEALRLMGSLEAQEKELSQLEGFCREQEEQEELRLAEEEQRARHARQVEQARLGWEQQTAALEGYRAQLQEKREGLRGLEERVQVRAEEVARAAHEAQTRQTLEQLAALQEQLESHERRREALQEELNAAPKVERDRLKTELHKQQESCTRLQKERDKTRRLAEAPFQLKGQSPAPDKELDRLKGMVRTSRQEISVLQEDERRGEAELEARTKEMDVPFQFQPPLRPKKPGRRQETVHKPVPIPKEQPPEVGKLLEAGHHRYLAVRTWEEASRAKAEAERLGAKLVAEESATSFSP